AQEIANHLAIALQTASLLERVQHHRERLQALSNRMLETQETERRLLAHELHDEIGQALTAVKLNLHRLERTAEIPAGNPVLTDCLRVTETALQQVRNLSLNLRPSMLDDLGLLPALRWYIHRHQERTGLAETLVCKDSLSPLPASLETACFRIVQEALTNIARHAQATAVTVTLTTTADTLELSIQDDGIGFDMQTVNQAIMQGSSLGLLGMQERASLVGGQVTITSEPGQGTLIHLKAPHSSLMTGLPPIYRDVPHHD
ncbi:MAG: sensor histidine kinase, partial [Nodosilinea sp.]